MEQLISDIINIVKKHVTEARESAFSRFKTDFDTFVDKAVIFANKNFLEPLGLSCEIVEYDFGSRRWLASYIGGSATDEQTVQIGINHKHMFNTMKKHGIEEDIFNIEAQARISIGHECGHGILEYLRETFLIYLLQYEDDLTAEENALIDEYLELYEDDEEELVEHFGECFFPPATHKRTCKMIKDLKKFIEMHNKIDNI